MTLPSSWSTQAPSLSDCMPVVGSIPNGTGITWAEYKDGRNERWSKDQTSAMTMRFATNADALRDPVRRRIIYDSVLGGWSNVDDKKHTPYRHPYAQGCYAKDVVGIEAMSTNERPSGAAFQYLIYNVEVMTISFESRSYPVAADTSPGTVNPNWMEVEPRPAGSRVQSPLGWYVFSTGSYSGWASLLGSFVSMPVGTLVVTLHQVPHNKIFTSADSYYPTFMSNFGQINQTATLGYAAEKLLLDGAEGRSFYSMMGDRLWDLRLIFGVNDWTFNKSLDPGNSVQSVRLLSKTSGIKPFTTFGLGTLLQNLNPA